jgi:putative hydrolase of HD superfamily
MDKEKIIDFLVEANKLKDVKRTGWLMVHVKDPESVAAHTFSVALMADVLASELKANRQKLLDMILVHDLCEVYAGDIATRKDGTMYFLGRKGEIRKFAGNKKLLEDRAMKKILNKLPNELKKKYSKLWREFEENKTKEAMLAHELDKLDYAILAILYKNRADRKVESFVHVRGMLKTKYLKDLQKIVERKFYK